MFEDESHVKNKRSFCEAFEKTKDVRDHDHDHMSGGGRGLMSLLLWHGQPNEDDDHNDLGKRASCPVNK